jgi:hypothetical protein
MTAGANEFACLATRHWPPEPCAIVIRSSAPPTLSPPLAGKRASACTFHSAKPVLATGVPFATSFPLQAPR